MELEQTRSYQIFLESLKTDSTKQNYIYWLNKYLDWKKQKISTIKNHDDLIKDPQEKIQTDIEDYIMSIRGKGRYAVKVSLYALFHFFAMNRIILNERLIKKLLPNDEQINKRRAYSNDDIKAILEAIEKTKIKKHKRWVYRKPRARAIIHFFASSGVRLGAITDMKYGDISKIENCYCIKVYAKTKSEHITFITPQATKYLDEYLCTRTDLTQDSSLFDIGYTATRQLINRLAIKAQVTTLTEVKKDKDFVNNKITSRQFKDIPIVHGFRSRWNTILKSNNAINKSSIEYMMGHSLIQLDKNYFKPTIEQLFAEYKKGIDALTIEME